MQAALAPRGDARTFLTHFVGSGLDDDRYVIHKDPEIRRARDRERFARRTAERQAAGLCPGCGKRRSEPEPTLCAPCAERARAAGRARDPRLRAAGKPRRNQERARVYERERTRRQTADRIAPGVCTKCGVLQSHATQGRDSIQRQTVSVTSPQRPQCWSPRIACRSRQPA